MPPRPQAELASLLSGVSVVNVCEDNPMRNAGDYWSGVGRNIGWVGDLGVLISLKEAESLSVPGDRSPLQGKLVIVGGSGLVGPGPFEDAIESIFPQFPVAVVFWGIGHNVPFGLYRDRITRWRRRLLMDDKTLLWPDYFASARLVGVRDYDAGMPWAPCASCMMPWLDEFRDVEPENDFAVVNGYWDPIDTSCARGRGIRFRHTNNNSESALEMLETIASGRAVVSNSYHALYWAALMGRAAVAVEPFDSRILHFRWPLARASSRDWLAAVERAEAASGALEEARAVTRAFSARVISLGKSLGLIDPGLDPDPGAGVRHTAPARQAPAAGVAAQQAATDELLAPRR